MIPLNDSSFFIKKDVYIGSIAEPITEDFKLITLDFISYNVTQIFRETSISENVISFNYDKIAKNLIFLLGTMSNFPEYSIYIFSLEKGIIIYRCTLKNEEIIGRLFSNDYCLSDGHIYYGNSCIKIRYDLICKNDKNVLYSED